MISKEVGQEEEEGKIEEAEQESSSASEIVV